MSEMIVQGTARLGVADPARASVPDPARASVPDPARASVPDPARASVPDPARAGVPEPARTNVNGTTRTGAAEPARAVTPEGTPMVVAETARGGVDGLVQGRPAVLILFGADAGETADSVIAAFGSACKLFEARAVAVVGVCDGSPRPVAGEVPVVVGPDRLARCGVGPGDVLVLMQDRRGRAVLALEPEEGVDLVAACLACLGHQAEGMDSCPAPLLAAMAEPLAVGGKAPPWFGMAADRRFYSCEEQYGRPALMILAGPTANAARAAAAVGAVLPGVARCEADVLLMTQDNPARLAAAVATPVRVVDAGDFLSRCGVAADQMMLMLVDRNQRIMLTRPVVDAAALADCLDCLAELPRESPGQITTPAPVIMLPHLLPPEMCRHLIALFDSVPAADSGVARVDAAGRLGNVVDHAKKRRRDMLIEPGTGLHAALQGALLRRCRVEIAKAFQCQVGFTDRMLVACYDSAGGWFRRHRDNDADQVAFREFALSLNLNTGEYEGGHLLFPEYNDHQYMPPAGAGVLFSASVLHEAAPVTAGRRYVLLTFLHGEAAEARRLAWEARARA